MEATAADDVLCRLVARGYVPDGADALEDALEAVDRRDFLQPPYDRFFDLDVPLPAAPGRRPGLSPRACVLLLRAVDLEPDRTLLIVGPDDAYLAALARRVTGATVESVRDPDEATGTWDRVLWLTDAGAADGEGVDHLNDLGVLLTRRWLDEALEVVKVVASGGATAEVDVTEARVVQEPYGATGRVAGADEDLGTLLALEASLARVWTANHLLQRERAWARSVDRTWRSRAPVGEAADGATGDGHGNAPPGDNAADADAAVHDAADDATDDAETWSMARRLFHVGLILQMHGDLETAVEAYTASLGAAASAEAYTFRGWTRSFQGDVEGAIVDCKRAVGTDPSLGNPYNDIGCYLLERGEPGDLDEAEAWFERAMEADRYEAPHFPHLNLARLHLRRGDRDKAVEAARESARIAPQDPATRELLRRLQGDEG